MPETQGEHMRHGIVCGLAVALLCACQPSVGFAPASARELDGATVSTPAMNVPQANQSGSTSGAAVAESDAGLFRKSFEDCVERSEGATDEMHACIKAELRFQAVRAETAYEVLRGMTGHFGRPLVPLSEEDWHAKSEHVCALKTENLGEAQQLEAAYCTMRNMAKRANELEDIIRRHKGSW